MEPQLYELLKVKHLALGQPMTPDSELPVYDRLRSAWDALHDEYRTRWGPGEENERYREIAEAFRPGLRALEVAPELRRQIAALRSEFGTCEGDTDLGAALSLTEHPIVIEGIRLRLAFDAIASLPDVDARLDDILPMLDDRRLSPRVEAYIWRAVWLFLWGWEPETVVMCGAAIEAAYRERFSDREMASIGATKDGPSYEPHQYERVAVDLGVLSRSQQVRARKIRTARNWRWQ
ncbi:MAG: hypothetical protein U9Q74_11390 [Gemmatimonadota bacterium]|nr:hypothetical protein [Gemmatimonadota bacterium]